MAVSTEAKEVIAQLVRALGAGRVERGLLRFPTETDSYGLGATDLDYVLSGFIGEELIVIIMPLNAQTESQSEIKPEGRGGDMKKMNDHELTPEQRELLDYIKKPRPCRRCKQLIEPGPDMTDLSGVVRLLEFWQSVSSAKDAIDSTPAFCPKCWRENQARAEQRWGLSSDVGSSEGSVVELALREMYEICTAIGESLSQRMCDPEFVEKYGEADWRIWKMAVPYGGWLILEKPWFEKEPGQLSEPEQRCLKLFWRLQNLLIEAFGGVPISASEFFPTKELRQWGQRYERQAGLQV